MNETVTTNPLLGERFGLALSLAIELHGDQARKGTELPYLGHILGVAAIVIDSGGSEEEIIAALLHDGPEDRGGERTPERIREEFGDEGGRDRERVQRHARVAEATLARAQAALPPSPRECLTWGAPRVGGRQAQQTRGRSSTTIAFTGRHHGRGLPASDGTLWYYRALAEVLKRRAPGPVTDELVEEADEMQGLR